MRRTLNIVFCTPCLLLAACLTRVTPPNAVEREVTEITVPLALLGYAVTTRCEDEYIVLQINEARECLHLTYEDHYVGPREASALAAGFLGALEAPDGVASRDRQGRETWIDDRTGDQRVEGLASDNDAAVETDGGGDMGVCLSALDGQVVTLDDVVYATDERGEVRLPMNARDSVDVLVGQRWLRASCENAVEFQAVE